MTYAKVSAMRRQIELATLTGNDPYAVAAQLSAQEFRPEMKEEKIKDVDPRDRSKQ